MRRLLLLALVGCGADGSAPDHAQLVLDIPNGALDPQGYTTVEITMHDAGGDLVRRAAIGADGAFDLGDMDPRTAVSIEAVLRNDGGTVVGYGRTSSALDLAGGSMVTVPVRRPIAYVAGVNYTLSGNTKSWFGLQGTYLDLSSDKAPDGTTMVGDKPALMISAGPELYAIDHAVISTTGAFSGQATLRAVSTADHATSPAATMLVQGIAQDGAGSDDGGTLVIGTTERLYAVDTRATPPLVRELASGNFSRLAIVAGPDGGLGAVAIQDRGDPTAATCSTAAKLWWIGGLGGEVIDARVVATGGFSDVAADRGRAWYVDACKGELGEALADGVRPVRADLGKPTALAVSNGQAWIGIERPAAGTTVATLVLEAAPVEATGGARRTLWVEPQEQILGATLYPEVERRLPGQAATFLQLEVGAGGEYVAAATYGRFFGPAILAANFPQMNLETRELRVFEAASGGVVQRYRTWCEGQFTFTTGDIDRWYCATTTGQGAPKSGLREHKLSSMTFQFGKK